MTAGRTTRVSVTLTAPMPEMLALTAFCPAQRRVVLPPCRNDVLSARIDPVGAGRWMTISVSESSFEPTPLRSATTVHVVEPVGVAVSEYVPSLRIELVMSTAVVPVPRCSVTLVYSPVMRTLNVAVWPRLMRSRLHSATGIGAFATGRGGGAVPALTNWIVCDTKRWSAPVPR